MVHTVQLHQDHRCSGLSRPFSTVARTRKSAVIEFLIAEGSSAIKIHRRMRSVYGEDSVNISLVRRLVRRLRAVETTSMTGSQRFSKEQTAYQAKAEKLC
jgi:hypothetical protein